MYFQSQYEISDVMIPVKSTHYILLTTESERTLITVAVLKFASTFLRCFQTFYITNIPNDEPDSIKSACFRILKQIFSSFAPDNLFLLNSLHPNTKLNLSTLIAYKYLNIELWRNTQFCQLRNSWSIFHHKSFRLFSCLWRK